MDKGRVIQKKGPPTTTTDIDRQQQRNSMFKPPQSSKATTSWHWRLGDGGHKGLDWNQTTNRMMTTADLKAGSSASRPYLAACIASLHQLKVVKEPLGLVAVAWNVPMLMLWSKFDIKEGVPDSWLSLDRQLPSGVKAQDWGVFPFFAPSSFFLSFFLSLSLSLFFFSLSPSLSLSFKQVLPDITFHPLASWQSSNQHLPLVRVGCGLNTNHQVTWEAFPLSHCAVLGNAFAMLLVNAPQRHPSAERRPLIYYELALLLLPAMLGGSSLGVIVGRIFPPALLIVLSIVLLVLTTAKTLVKARHIAKAARAREDRVSTAVNLQWYKSRRRTPFSLPRCEPKACCIAIAPCDLCCQPLLHQPKFHIFCLGDKSSLPRYESKLAHAGCRHARSENK